MPRRPSPNPPGPGDQIRISFLLDRRREPDLAYIFDMQGHGDRPRELLRLAQLGHQYEVELKEMRAAARLAGLASLGHFIEPAQEAPVASRAAQPVGQVSHELPAKKSVDRAAMDTRESARAQSPSASAEAPAEQTSVPPEPVATNASTSNEVDGLDGFLA